MYTNVCKKEIMKGTGRIGVFDRRERRWMDSKRPRYAAAESRAELHMI